MVMTREARGTVEVVEHNDEPHRDDAQVLDIIVKAIAEFNIRCDFASSIAVNALAPNAEFMINDGDRAQVTLGIVKDGVGTCAQLIIKRLEEKGFAVGMFR